jgi:hypothetical protein
MITDDDLLLYHYRDGLEPTERARIGAALAEQPELAQRLHRLVARLDALAAMPEVPVPAQTRQRWQAALDRAVAGGRPAATPQPRRAFTWQFAAAAAVLVVALAAVLRLWQPATEAPMTASTPPESPVAPDAPAGAEVTAYEKGLKFHLADTERQLVNLEQATPEERARLVDTIISQNRLYALAAERAGEPQLARVLRAFTPVLEEVAQGKGESKGEVSQDSLAQLSFEMRVMQARLGADARSPSNIL